MTFSRRSLLAASTLALLVRDGSSPAAALQERASWPTEGWKRRRPEDHGMDPGLLAQADQVIATTMPDVTGLVVIHDGLLLFERYYGDRYGRTDPVKIRSITKSVISALVGIALDEGALKGLDQPIGDLLPNRIPDNADPLTPSITLGQLLTMTSGWAWDIGSDYQTLISSPNWADLTLGLPVVYEPGTFYAYNTGGSHLLSVILGEATGQLTEDFAQEKLFDPLGIARPTWQQSPQGETVGGFGLELTPRDLAKFGFLFLNEGRWEDRQLVPADYVRGATSYQSAGDSTGNAAYGYQWWVADVAGLPSYFGLGFGSQYVYVVPGLDLVCVVAHGFDDAPPAVTPSRPLIEGYVVPAVFA